MPSTRSYDNRLREEKALATADRIVKALCDLLVDERPAKVSIPMVAARAGVSVRTVYTHFPTKEDLFDAIGPYVERTFFVETRKILRPSDDQGPPDDVAGTWARALARAIPLFTALVRSGIDDDEHARQRSARRQVEIAGLLRNALPDLGDDDFRRLVVAFDALVSWQTVQRMERSGATIDQAAELISWMVDAVVDRARTTGTVGAAPGASGSRRPASERGRTGGDEHHDE